MFVITYMLKDLYPEYKKNSLKLSNKEKTNKYKKTIDERFEQKPPNTMENKHRKTQSTSVIREIQHNELLLHTH